MTIVTGSESSSQPADDAMSTRAGKRVNPLVVAMRQMLVQGFVWCHVVA